MNTFDDIMRKRSILLTTRIRFFPQFQPVKETAIDKIIEQILFVAPGEKDLSLQEIQEIFSSESGGYAITSADMENSCKRLIKKERIMSQKKEGLERYRLSEKTTRELGEMQHRTEVRFNSVVDRLFKNAKEGTPAFRAPFLKLLCVIFSQLAEEYVGVIKGEVKSDEFLSFPLVSSALRGVKKEFTSINGSLLESAALSFFRDSDPEYDAIKWNVAQNYYIAKALGLDPTGVLLSREVFGNAVFYLDTNIIIRALEPTHKRHKGFLAFNRACKQLSITLRVCQISLDELRTLLAHQRRLIEKVADQIPDETAPEVRSDFYEIYCEKKRASEAVNVGTCFANFDSPMNRLKTLFKVELEDDIWFDKAKNKEETIKYAETLRAKYYTMRKHPKRQGSAVHDALLLLWLQRLREDRRENIWLITTDTSLPACPPSKASSESLAITWDAILQWISTIGIREDAMTDFPAMFAEMLKYRLLPQDRIFNLEDFLIFHEMHISCKELPSEDVENCIRYIKSNAPMLDPSNPADREKLAYEVSKFFTVPERKYKQDITRLEVEKHEAVQEYEKKLGEASQTIKKLTIQHKEALEKLTLQHEEAQKKSAEKIEEIEGKFSEYQKMTQGASLRTSAHLRVGITAIIFLALEGLAFFLANRYGEGANLFQKLSNSWEFLIGGFLITIAAGWLILGKKRLAVLGWPFKKIFKP